MEALQMQLRDLQRQETELLASLEAIDQQFEELGFPLSTVLPKEDMREPSAQLDLKRSGLRIGNTLSFRGQKKASELFRMMDTDRDGLIGYEEVRAMGAFSDRYGVVRNGEYQSRAAFAVAMRSLGVPLIGDGRLNEEAFQYLRVRIDDRQPLSRELLGTGLGLLPGPLRRWAGFKQLLLEAEALRADRLNEQERELLQDRIAAEEFQHLLGVAAVRYHFFDSIVSDIRDMPPIVPLTRVETARLLLLARRRQITGLQLTRVAAHRMLAQRDFPFTLQDENNDHHHRAQQQQQQQQQHSHHPQQQQPLKQDPPRLALTFDEEEEAIIGAEDLRSVSRSTALALLLALPFTPFQQDETNSHRQQQQSQPLQVPSEEKEVALSWYRWGLGIKASLFELLRGLYYGQGRLLFALAGHFNDRLLFRDFVAINQLPSALQEMSTIKVSFSLGGSNRSQNTIPTAATMGNSNTHANANASNRGGGSAGKDLSGVSMSFKLLRLDGGVIAASSSSSSGHKKGQHHHQGQAEGGSGGGVEAAVRKLGGPPGAGSAISMDLLCRVSATPEEVQQTAAVLRQTLMRHLEVELKAVQASCLGLFVVPAEADGDDAPVIRLLLAFKRAVSVDRWLEHLLLPYKLMDLLPAFAGDLRTSLDLKDLSSNRVNSLDDLCAAQLNCTANLRRGLIVAILQRAAAACSASLGLTEVNPVGGNGDGHSVSNSQAKSQAGNGDGDDNASQASAASSTTVSTTFHAALNDRGLFADMASTASADDEEVRRRRKALVAPSYPQLAFWARYLVTMLQPLGAAFTWRRQYRSLSQLVTLILPRRLQATPGLDELLTKPGRVREALTALMGSMGQQAWQLFEHLRQQLEAKKKETDAARLRALLAVPVKPSSAHPDEEKKKKEEEEGQSVETEATTVARLQRLGVSEQEAVTAVNSARAGNDTAHILQGMAAEQRDRDVLNLRCLEAVRRTLLGIHAMDLLSGKSRLAMSITGLDLVDLLLPADPPPMQRAVDDNQVRHWGGKSRASSPEAMVRAR